MIMAASACASQSKADGPSWADVVKLATKATYPIDNNWREYLSFLPSEDQNRKIYDEWQQGIATCMSSRGLLYQAGNYYGELVFDRRNPLNREFAATFGYHDPSIIAFPQPRNTDSADPNGYAAALEGSGGCASKSAEVSLDLVSGYTEQVDELLQDLMRELADVGNVAQEPLIAGWSTCMSSAGLDFESPNVALTKFVGEKKISSTELKVRLADFDCDRQVGLTVARSDAQRAALGAWQERNSANLDRLAVQKSAFDAIVAKFG